MLNRIKLLLLVSIVLFSFSVFPIGTSAEKIGNKEKVIQRFTEIKDINKLYERAKNGVSDVNREVEKNFVAKVVLQSTDGLENGTVQTYSTSQLLKVSEVNGDKIETYATTTFYDISDLYNGNFQTNDSSNKSKYDSSISVRAYSTVYYTTSSIDGEDYTDLTKVSGGWTILDSTVSLSNRKVNFGATGWAKSGVGYVQQTSYNNPTSNSFSYSAPSSWAPISVVSTGRIFGVTTWVTLKRGTNSVWELQLVNNI